MSVVYTSLFSDFSIYWPSAPFFNTTQNNCNLQLTQYISYHKKKTNKHINPSLPLDESGNSDDDEEDDYWKQGITSSQQ